MPGRCIVQFPTWTDIEVFLEAGRKEKDIRAQEILYTGVLIPRKGVHHLINAFVCVTQDFLQARLVIAGREEDKIYAAELKQQVKRLGLDGHVRFVGEMPQAELATWMHRAGVFVLPSISEGLGRVVIEAMATGTPVIGSHVGGIPEMVHDGATGFLVPPEDEAALAEKIRWVFEQPERTREMGRDARAFAEKFFSTRAYINGYRQIFEDAQVFLTNDEHAPSTV
jgi:glycosyltransferase involved in cell wall biosynthesis